MPIMPSVFEIFFKIFKETDGLISADFFHDEQTQEAGGFTVYEPEETTNAVLEKLQSLLQRTIGGSDNGTFTLRRFVHTLRVDYLPISQINYHIADLLAEIQLI